MSCFISGVFLSQVRRVTWETIDTSCCLLDALTNKQTCRLQNLTSVIKIDSRMRDCLESFHFYWSWQTEWTICWSHSRWCWRTRCFTLPTGMNGDLQFSNRHHHDQLSIEENEVMKKKLMVRVTSLSHTCREAGRPGQASFQAMSCNSQCSSSSNPKC